MAQAARSIDATYERHPAWGMVAVAAMIGAAFMGSTLVTPLYALYQREFGFSTITLTLIYAVYVVGNLVALLLFGRLSDQMGRRNVGLAAMILAICSVAIFFFAHGTVWLYAGRGLSGLAVGIASGTGTAWLAELYRPHQRANATVTATVGNMTGIAVGPLLGGLLAQYAPAPMQLPFLANAVILIVAGIMIRFAPPETVRSRVRRLRDVDLHPRVGVPKNIRARFIAPAICGFACFALGGFYFALIPSVLRQSLHISSVAVAGAVVFEMVAVTVAVLIFARGIGSRAAMFAGLVLLVPAAGLLVAAQLLGSVALLLVASTLAGAALALGYRGGLQVVNEIAPNDRRGEVASSYFIAMFLGNSVPVIGVGVLSTLFTPNIASIALAVVITLLSALSLATNALSSGAKHRFVIPSGVEGQR